LSRARIGVVSLVTVTATFGVLQLLGRRSGSTKAERASRLGGDDVVAFPQVVTNHAITIEASPQDIWPWLAQMGWHRAGYYTPRWVDEVFFPGNWSSLDHLDPALSSGLAVGQCIPDGPSGTAFFTVVRVDPTHELVLHSTTHLPPGWRERFGTEIDWTWNFRLTALGPDRTRLLLRVRGRTSPWWVTAAYVMAIIPADLVMARGMLRGIKERAERGGS